MPDDLPLNTFVWNHEHRLILEIQDILYRPVLYHGNPQPIDKKHFLHRSFFIFQDLLQLTVCHHSRNLQSFSGSILDDDLLSAYDRADLLHSSSQQQIACLFKRYPLFEPLDPGCLNRWHICNLMRFRIIFLPVCRKLYSFS